MTSVLSSSNQATHALKRPDKSIPSGIPDGADAARSGEFGALFGALMGVVPGQDLAAPAAADGKSSPTPQGLAAEVLGPSVHIITTTEPATTDESLMAFARSQGLDAEALAMIFGRKAVDHALPAASKPADTPALGPDLAMAPAPPAREPAQTATLLAGTTSAGVATADIPAAGNKPANTLDLGPDARISWTLGETSTPAKPAGAALQATMFGLNGVRAMLPQADTTRVAEAEQAAHPESAQQSLAASLMLGAAEASQFARRLQMKQGSQRAERLADTLPQLASASAASPGAQADEALETLTLDTGLPDSELQMLVQQRQPDGRPAGDGASANGSPTVQHSDIGERAEQYDKLSQRLGEALGQRLAAQIAKGDWKVEMALRPLDLGKIDIELKMNGGQLEASFHASEAGTRDLIVNGLPKLKEVMAQLGMEVASVDVNVRQESQSGGNPTPGKPSSGIASPGAKPPGDDVPAAAGLLPARSVNSSNDGLDVLV